MGSRGGGGAGRGGARGPGAGSRGPAAAVVVGATWQHPVGGAAAADVSG